MGSDLFVTWPKVESAPSRESVELIVEDFIAFPQKPKETGSDRLFVSLPGPGSDAFKRQHEILGEHVPSAEATRAERGLEVFHREGVYTDLITRQQDHFTNAATLGLGRVLAATFAGRVDGDYREYMHEAFGGTPRDLLPRLLDASFAVATFDQAHRFVEDYVGDKSWVHQSRGDGGNQTQQLTVVLPGKPTCALERVPDAPGYLAGHLNLSEKLRQIELIWKGSEKRIFVTSNNADQFTISIAHGLQNLASTFFQNLD